MKRKRTRPLGRIEDLMKQCKGCKSFFLPSRTNQVWCWQHHAMTTYQKQKLFGDLFEPDPLANLKNNFDSKTFLDAAADVREIWRREKEESE